MRTIFSVIPIVYGNSSDEFSMEVLVNDGTLSCLSAKDLKNTISRVRGKNNKEIPAHIKFIIDSNHDFLEYNSFFRKLDEATDGNIDIDIITSGSNLNSIMTCLWVRNGSSNYSIYVDDQNVRNNLEQMDFSRVGGNCYLSKRYLRNLSEEDFFKVCSSPNFKFNRKEAIREREIIKNVWRNILPTFESLDGIKTVTKIALVSDYIKQNIKLVGSNSLKEEISSYINSSSIDSPMDVYQQKRGSNNGQVALMTMLLDNYYAKTDCRQVEEVDSKNNSNRWLAVSTSGGNYFGFPLSVSKGVSEFIKKGSRAGRICLEDEHKDRDDYEIVIHSFGDVLSSKYANIKDKVSKAFGTIKSEFDSKVETARQYQKDTRRF